jgi:hypothetical protein
LNVVAPSNKLASKKASVNRERNHTSSIIKITSSFGLSSLPLVPAYEKERERERDRYEARGCVGIETVGVIESVCVCACVWVERERESV